SSNPTQQTAAETLMLRELLHRMIDERLEEQAADRAHLSATADEIDKAIRQVAAHAKLTPAEVLLEANHQGLSEEEYRDEIRRQILEGKLVELRVRGRVHVTDEDARLVYSKWLVERAESTVDLRIISLPSAAGTVAARTTLAQQIVARARAGVNFCT